MVKKKTKQTLKPQRKDKENSKGTLDGSKKEIVELPVS